MTTFLTGVVRNAVIQIWDDLSNEHPGYYRAFWCAGLNDTCGSPVIGHCSPGGSHRTIFACIREVRRMGYTTEAIYRNGKLITG